MEEKKTKRISRRWIIRISAIVLALIIAAIGGGVVAKYVQQRAVTGKIRIISGLGGIDVLEHSVTDDHGIYTLNTGSANEVKANKYDTLPGVDVPKDPFVRVADKSEVPAYLYLEVTGIRNNVYCWITEENWVGYTGAGPHGGSIYVYGVGYNPTTISRGAGLIDANGNGDIPILVDNYVNISEWLTADDNCEIKFYAYMISAEPGENPYTVFDSVYHIEGPAVSDTPDSTESSEPTTAPAARLSAECAPVVNTFEIRQLTPAEAVYGAGSSASVSVPAEGYPVFVRAYYTVNWVNADGNVYGTAPVAGVDYVMGDMASGWFVGDNGFCYYQNAVGIENSDLPFIGSVMLTSDAVVPEGYSLKLDVVVQTIQAIGWTDEDNTVDGADVPFVTAAWHVVYNGNDLTVSAS